MKKKWAELLWDAWCVLSGIGIWPRYIEPRCLSVTSLLLPIYNLPRELEGLKILHFSDLHWSHQFSSYLLKKLIRKANFLKPDLIVFTGDFLCRSTLSDAEKLKKVLNSFKAKIGCFAVLGNHDYERFVTINKSGDYDIELPSKETTISKGFKRLFRSIKLTKHITDEAKQVGCHQELIDLIQKTPFQLLNNETKQISYKGCKLNICGLEEYTIGKFNPEKAFKDYLKEYPGIILSHNPDSLKVLKNYPGDLILSGHTHGGQVNLPFFWKKFTLLENPQLKSGLKSIGQKWVYINRGISAAMNFRWFAPPELTLITLKADVK